MLWKDLLDGKFSTHVGGMPVWNYEYDSTAFDNLIADESFDNFYGIIESSDSLNEWVEKHICVPYNLAYRIDGNGTLVPIDMRLPSSISSNIPTISHSDTVANKPPKWTQDRTKAITRIDHEYYIDSIIGLDDILRTNDYFPNVPTSLLKTQKVKITQIDIGTAELGEKKFVINDLGKRIIDGWYKGGRDKGYFLPGIIAKRLEEYRSPYAFGEQAVTVYCIRNNITENIYPGDLIELDLPLPNAASNTKTGSRLTWCTERTENKIYINFTFVDVGDASVCTSPSLGVLSLTAGKERHSVTVPVTFSCAQTDPADFSICTQYYPAILEFAATDINVVTRPVDNSSLWTAVSRYWSEGTEDIYITELPSGKRIWIRGRSIPHTDESPRLPSPWVFPSGNDYIDTDAIDPPTSATVTSIDGCSAKLSWTNVENETIELAFAETGDTSETRTLPENTTEWVMTNLKPSTSYTWSVKYIDFRNSRSSSIGTTFSTTTDTQQGPTPLGLFVLVGDKA